MKAIGALRNACAHHGRVWNRIMATMPQLPTSLRSAWIVNKPQTANRLYAVLCCIVYWLNAIDVNNTLKADFKALHAKYPNVDIRAMEFPVGWEQEPLWK